VVQGPTLVGRPSTKLTTLAIVIPRAWASGSHRNKQALGQGGMGRRVAAVFARVARRSEWVRGSPFAGLARSLRLRGSSAAGSTRLGGLQPRVCQVRTVAPASDHTSRWNRSLVVRGIGDVTDAPRSTPTNRLPSSSMAKPTPAEDRQHAGGGCPTCRCFLLPPSAEAASPKHRPGGLHLGCRGAGASGAAAELDRYDADGEPDVWVGSARPNDLGGHELRCLHPANQTIRLKVEGVEE
jgi:hypothetical protein